MAQREMNAITKSYYQTNPPRWKLSGGCLAISGRWVFPVALQEGAFRKTDGLEITSIEGSRLEELDLAGAATIMMLIAKGSTLPPRLPKLENISAEARELLKLVFDADQQHNSSLSSTPSGTGSLTRLGRLTLDKFREVPKLLSFLGESVCQLAKSRVSLIDTVGQLNSCLVQGLVIVAMVSFLIGLVIAYLFAEQIQKFGANIFIVDVVSIAYCRELSPMLTAIVVTGRSGSAFTAELAAMKLNQEVEALTVMGLSPFRFLIWPRLIALIITFTLLTFLSDILGITGGLIIAQTQLGVTSHSFIERIGDVLAPRHYLIGLAKAPLFATLVGIIACYNGLSSEPNAVSLGKNTTKTVVSSIVLVIILDAIIAVLLSEIGW